SRAAPYTLSLPAALPMFVRVDLRRVVGRPVVILVQPREEEERRDLLRREVEVVAAEEEPLLGPQVGRHGQTYIIRVRARDLLGRSEEHTSELQSRENLVC